MNCCRPLVPQEIHKFFCGDSGSFGFDTNTGRPTSFSASVKGALKAATITNNTNGTIQTVVTADALEPIGAQTCSAIYDDLGRLQSNNCGK